MDVREEEYLARLAEQEAFKSLCRSLFVRALRDYVTYKHSRKPGEKRLFAEAGEWIYNGHKVEDPRVEVSDRFVVPRLSKKTVEEQLLELDRLMSFESVCAILGWDADLVRKRVRVLTQSDLDRIGPNLMDL